MHVLHNLLGFDINTTAFNLDGPIQPSSPTTKEFHGQDYDVRTKPTAHRANLILILQNTEI